MKHRIERIRFSGRIMVLRADAKDYRIPLDQVSTHLLQASKIERETLRISPSGYGIHWPLLDEDLSVDGLIRAARIRSGAKVSA